MCLVPGRLIAYVTIVPIKKKMNEWMSKKVLLIYQLFVGPPLQYLEIIKA